MGWTMLHWLNGPGIVLNWVMLELAQRAYA
jgi:hypothetical protein